MFYRWNAVKYFLDTQPNHLIIAWMQKKLEQKAQPNYPNLTDFFFKIYCWIPFHVRNNNFTWSRLNWNHYMIPENTIIFATYISCPPNLYSQIINVKKFHLAKVNITFILPKMSIINTRLPYSCHKMSWFLMCRGHRFHFTLCTYNKY